MKQWVFIRPVHVQVIKPNGRHYVVKTDKGFVEKDEDVVVVRKLQNIADLKRLRRDIRRGKYLELVAAPVNDQLWATIAHRAGFLKIIEEDEDET